MRLPSNLAATARVIGSNLCRGIAIGVLASGGATLAHATVPLVQLTPTEYQTEHCLFIIDSSVTWSSPSQAYADLYTASNGTFPKLSGYFDTLTAQFPATYFSVCYMAVSGASNVPNYIDRIYKASGISEPGTAGAAQSFATVDMCRYNLASPPSVPALAVYDHEIGHAWGAQLFNTLSGPALSNGHWLPNSTVACQLGGTYSDDGYLTVKKIYGDPSTGFRWQAEDNLRWNDTDTFSEQQLYAMGLAPTFATAHVLNSPAYNSDGTMSYASVDTFDHAAVLSKYGARNPDYTTSAKQFHVGFVYIARDVAEVNSVYQAVEKSVDNSCNGEAIDAVSYRFQVPFLCDTKYRASIDGRLSDLDGNSVPTLTLASSYITSSDGTASVSFTASDTAGSPTVSVVPTSTHASVSGSTVQLSGLPDGVHFFTLKAQDSAGKKAFAHFVVEVQRAGGAVTITSSPASKTATAGSTATFAVAATGTPASLSYRWMLCAAGTSTWNDLSDGGNYSGSGTSTLSVTTSTAMDGDKFLCLVSNTAGAATSQSAALVINEVAPPLTTQPSDVSLSSGGAAHFNVAVAGAPTTYGYPHYQWQRQTAGTSSWTSLVDGTGCSGSTSASLTLSGTTTAMNGDQMRCVVTNSAGTTTSSIATMTVGSSPAITTQPTSVTTTAGQTATFTVVASGTAPLSYQWSRYGTAVTGATSATLTLANVQSTDAGAYTVAVTNAFGATNSNVGSLTVSAAAPSITAQPQSASTTAGSTVSFTVTAVGTTPMTYQWKNNGSAISGATSATLSLTNVQSADAANYTVVVTNSVSSVTSSVAALTLTSVAVAPSLTAQPQAQTVTAGQDAAFSVTATGTAPLSYQWRKNGSAIAGATSATLTLTAVQASDAANYSVVVTNSAGSVTSSDATLTVNAAVVAPSISAQPQSASVTAGQSASFTVTAAGTAPLSYQWQKGAVALSGATSATLSLANVQAADAGNYSVVVTNSAGSVTSTSATLTVNAAAVAPTISAQPQSASVTAGQSASFTVTAAGTAPLSYQWQKGAAALSGATAATLSLANVQAADAGNYSVVVTNSAGSVTSSGATLTVTAAANAPTITTHPVATSITAGQSVTFTIIAAGTGPLSYQWQKDGVAIAGATGATLTFVAGNADAGDYAVVVTNSAGTVTSNAAHLSVVVVVPPPVVTSSPQNVSLPAGQTTAFSVSATGATGYQWTFNGVPIAGANAATLTLANVQAGNAGSYAVIVSSAGGSVTSTAATLTLAATDYSGGYFGQFGAEHDGGDFALIVAHDGSATLIAGFTQTGKAVIARGVSIDANGGFNLGTQNGSLTAAAVADSRLFTGIVAGQITAGTVMLNVPALSVSGSGNRSTGAATLPVPAGVYSAVPIGGGADDVYFAADETGRTVVVDLSDGMVRTGTGTTAPDGTVQVTASAGHSTTLFSGTLSGGAFHGSATRDGATVEVAAPPSSSGRQRLVNIASRGFAGTSDQTLIAGFVIAGSQPKDVLIRAIGPGLAALGVAGGLADPQLKLFQGGTVLLGNDDWGSATGDIASKAAMLGAFPLVRGSRDSAVLVRLPPGVYTAQVSGADNRSGVALIEVYDGGATDATAPKVVNISTRAFVGRDDAILIAGFVIAGDAPKKVLIRGAGPALTALGVGGALADPELTLFHGSVVVRRNDNWADDGDASLVASTASTIGASSWAAGSKDAAMLLYLQPGVYTVHLAGVGNTSGVGLLEVYEVTD